MYISTYRDNILKYIQEVKEMKELFNKPILDQMYEFRKDYFEQYVYENNKK